MSALTVPPHARFPTALLLTVAVVVLATPLARGGPDLGGSGTPAAVAQVRAASTGPVGPGPITDEALVSSAVTRGDRPAVPPAPRGRLAEEGAALLDALGLGRSEPVTHDELLAAAETLGVATGGWVREEHLDAMHHAFLQRARPAVVGLDVPTSGDVGPEHIRQAAAAVGLDLGEQVEPAEVRQVLQLAPDFPAGPTPRLGVVAGINLRMPSRVPIMAGFHQASYGNAIPIHRLEHPAAGVLPSRGRGTGMTSAIDVRVPPDTTVLAPIRGTVVEVTPYDLYGKYPDVKIRMVPESDPTLLVTILHVSDPLVAVGQRLEAGDPLAGRATLFPFESQIDRFAGRGPHVHLEARRR